MSREVQVRFYESRAVRFRPATHLAVGFEHRDDAHRFQAELRERFAKFGLELHADKTRLIEFGRRAACNRARRGLGRPETFDFLGFTHMCATSRRPSCGKSRTNSHAAGIYPFRNKGSGCVVWSAVTSPTTRCPEILTLSRRSAPRLPGTGFGRCGGEVNGRG
jgi:hypothetical protein